MLSLTCRTCLQLPAHLRPGRLEFTHAFFFL